MFEKDCATSYGAMSFSKMVEEIDKEIGNENENKFDPFNPLDELNGNASISCIYTPST